VRVSLGLSRVIGGNIRERGFVQRLRDAGHELIRPAAGSVVIELLVDCRARLTGKIGIFGSRGYALLAMAGDADLLRLGETAFRSGFGENLQYGGRPYHL